ncbi:MAG TPA: hypothetical protein VF832_03705, partial [Longimicrobiales bacterium]
MKLRVLAVAVFVLVPGVLRAQIVRRGPEPNVRAGQPVQLNSALIEKMIPVLQAAGYSSEDTSFNAKLAARGMNKTDYIAHKNALMIARQDDLNPGRLTALKGEDGGLQARQANARLYHANKARLDVLLSKLHADPGCDLCSGPTVPVKQ